MTSQCGADSTKFLQWHSSVGLFQLSFSSGVPVYPASIRWVAQWYPSVHWVNQWYSSGIPVYTGPASVHWLKVRAAANGRMPCMLYIYIYTNVYLVWTQHISQRNHCVKSQSSSANVLLFLLIPRNQNRLYNRYMIILWVNDCISAQCGWLQFSWWAKLYVYVYEARDLVNFASCACLQRTSNIYFAVLSEYCLRGSLLRLHPA